MLPVKVELVLNLKTASETVQCPTHFPPDYPKTGWEKGALLVESSEGPTGRAQPGELGTSVSLAVFKFKTSSTFTGNMTGKSQGF